MSDETHGIIGAAASKGAKHSAEAQRHYDEALEMVLSLKGRSVPQECVHPDHMDAVYSAVACFGCHGGTPSPNYPQGAPE